MMSSGPLRRIPSPSMLATQAALTARNAGCEIDENAESLSWVVALLQSSSVQNASGEPLQSPVGQKRGGGGVVAGGVIAPGATAATSPSSINRASGSPAPLLSPQAATSSPPAANVIDTNLHGLRRSSITPSLF